MDKRTSYKRVIVVSLLLLLIAIVGVCYAALGDIEIISDLYFTKTGGGTIYDVETINFTGDIVTLATDTLTVGSITIATNTIGVAADTDLLQLAANALTVSGSIDILHTAAEADDHTLELDVDAAGYGDVKAIDIDYITGAISAGKDEGIILINIDEILATGGDVFGLEVLATEGSAGIYGMKVGAVIGPVHQDSGVFVNPTTGTDNTTSTDVPNMIDAATNTITAIFDNNSEYILIGASATFEEIEFIITTGASRAGIKPTFGYSTAGSHTFTQFTPVDGTNGFRNTGVVAWDAGDLSSHGINTNTSTYDIKITRTRNSLSTSPVLGYAKVAATTEYIWNKNGDINIRGLTAGTATITDCAVLGSDSAVFQPNTDSTTFFQVLDADGGTPVLNVDSTNEKINGTNFRATDTENTFFGTGAGAGWSSGDYNIAFGFNALALGDPTENTALGRYTLYKSTGVGNMGVGNTSLFENTSGLNNIGIGRDAGRSNNTGSYNVSIGTNAGYGPATQAYNRNVFIGDDVGGGITTGSQNVVIGARSGFSLSSGNSNIFIGYQAGYRQTTLSNLLIIDNQIRADVATELTNAILYGVMAATPASQTLRINASTLVTDKIAFTQTDLNEYIDSLDPNGMLDYGATLEHRFWIGGTEQINLTDGALAGTTDNDVDLGKVNVEFKDLFIDGTAHIDTLDVDINAAVAGNLTVGGNVVAPLKTKTIDHDTDGVIDVEGISTLFVNTTGDDISINGFTNGINGQVLHIANIGNTNYKIDINQASSGGNQDIYLNGGSQTIYASNYGGWILVCDGSNWYDTNYY